MIKKKPENTILPHSPLRLAILQRVCPEYRVPLFRKLSGISGIDVELFTGQNIPNTKVRNSLDLSGIKNKKFKTFFIRCGKRIFPWHIGLIRELKMFKPDVILCEAESHFIGYLQAIFYKLLCNKKTRLIYWCYIALPGCKKESSLVRYWIKRFFRQFFCAFLLYSSYGKKELIRLGYPEEKIFVATNVGDTEKFSKLATALTISKIDAKNKLKLPNKFTVLYLGALDHNKRPDLMLDLAGKIKEYNFVLLGSGALDGFLARRAKEEVLDNLFLFGRVVDDLPYYLRASDILVVPGRGGIVISEAMAFGLPVIVHQADGTEYDLVQNNVTGVHLTSGNMYDFYNALKYFQENPVRALEYGRSSQELINRLFTTEKMVEQIVKVSCYVLGGARKK